MYLINDVFPLYRFHQLADTDIEQRKDVSLPDGNFEEPATQ